MIAGHLTRVCCYFVHKDIPWTVVINSHRFMGVKDKQSQISRNFMSQVSLPWYLKLATEGLIYIIGKHQKSKFLPEAYIYLDLFWERGEMPKTVFLKTIYVF